MLCRSLRRWVILVLAAAFVGTPALATAGGTLYLQKTAPVHKDLDVRDAIKNECAIEKIVMDFVESYAKDGFDKVERVDNAAKQKSGKALGVTIVHLEALSGGPWSGRKSITLEGTLYENGKAVSNFRAKRQTKGGMKTCPNLNHIAKSLGKDIGKWLQDPKKDAQLGDL